MTRNMETKGWNDINVLKKFLKPNETHFLDYQKNWISLIMHSQQYTIYKEIIDHCFNLCNEIDIHPQS